MNLTKLFQIQKELDQKIVNNKELEGWDLLPERVLALQVELGECANEWRGFKFWSEDQEPRRYKEKEVLINGVVTGVDTDPLLEEYVDCLHFVLSIGLYGGFDQMNLNIGAVEGLKRKDIVTQFNYLFQKIGDFSSITNHNNYMYILPLFIGLGEMLGFTWNEIEQAYLDKNKINHERQANGY
ncbi:hypothetical protein EH196_06960 [Bacillus sp. C1-1]|nr:hypothetical protein EH196_06960 [Bacillus sp. C1-1]